MRVNWRPYACCFAVLGGIGVAHGQDDTNTFWPAPYMTQGWPAQHHDAHNSDWMPLHLRSLDPHANLPALELMLREPGDPVICLGGGTIGLRGTNEYFIVTTGKVNYPNLWALDLADGHVYWHAAPPTNAVDPGPEACALTIAPVIDRYGFIYMADCHYVYCYHLDATPDAHGNQPWVWRAPMPNLKWYNAGDGHWYPTNNPAADDVKASPFMSFVLTPEVGSNYYFGGFTVEGETFMFSATNGALVASAYLETNVIGAVTGDAPCDAWAFAVSNNPVAPHPEEMPIFMGIWATGSNTDDPDEDYFMNPCQLESYLEAGTFGTGSMIANNPCLTRDPTNAAKCALFIAGRQSSTLKAYDVPLTEEDAILYRVDFDPTQEAFSNRLVILNYVITNQPALGPPDFAFNGRMPNGINSATAPDCSANERWIFVGDKASRMYCFSAENGRLNWVRQTGEALGSPTTFQHADTNGWFDFITLGDYEPTFIKLDMETGLIVTNAVGEMIRRLDYGSFIVSNYWRTEAPYQQAFIASNGQPFTRSAIGASIIPAGSNFAEMVYTVGWMNPTLTNLTSLLLIPTHQVVLFVDPAKVWEGADEADTVLAAYIDTNGTSEAGFLPSPSGYPRGLMFYGVQSCCLANYLSTNNWMPEGMKPLYMYPYGGLGLMAIPFEPPVRFTESRLGPDGLTLGWDTEWPMSGYTLVESPSLIDPTWTPVTPTNQWPSQKTGWTGSLDAATRFYDLVPTP